MCDVVGVLIDNLRPMEEQVNEDYFLDDEIIGDEDWNEDNDDIEDDDGYAVMSRKGMVENQGMGDVCVRVFNVRLGLEHGLETVTKSRKDYAHLHWVGAQDRL